MAEIEIPTIGGGGYKLNLEVGSVTVFVGANGSGKTRLAALLDERLEYAGSKSHRLGAHRALILPEVIQLVGEQLARQQFTYGPSGQIFQPVPANQDSRTLEQ